MDYVGLDDISGLAVKQKGKYAVYVRDIVTDDIIGEVDDFYEDRDCIPITKFVHGELCKLYAEDIATKLYNIIIFDGLVFFDTKEEMLQFYSIFEHCECRKVYARTYDPDGNSLDIKLPRR